jgi:excisionase family DNA binding protein
MGIMMVAVTPEIEKLFECYGERLTPEQVGEAIGQSPNTIRRLLRDGDLPGYRSGTGRRTSWVLVKSEMIAALRSRWNQGSSPATDSITVQTGADSKE